MGTDPVRIIINADDLGMTRGTNEGIFEAATEGLVSSVSLIVTMPASNHAIEQIIPQIKMTGVGIHISLDNGRCLSSPENVPHLVYSNGYFKHKFSSLVYMLTYGSKKEELISEIEREIDAQITKVLNNNILVDHIDGQSHIHMIPEIFSIVTHLARRYNIRAIRTCFEPYYFCRKFSKNLLPFSSLIDNNFLKHIVLNHYAKKNKKKLNGMTTTDTFYGVLHTGKMDVSVLTSILQNLKGKTVEILTHPGKSVIADGEYIENNLTKKHVLSKNRLVELEATKSSEIKSLITKQNYKIVTFKDI